MWHTPSGVRILTGAEAELFRAGLAGVLSGLEEGQWGDKLEVGIKTFDELTYEQKLAMLEHVAMRPAWRTSLARNSRQWQKLRPRPFTTAS